MPDSTPSMAAYHRGLSTHLTKLLRATGKAMVHPMPSNHSSSATTSSTALSKVSTQSTSENEPSTTSSPDNPATPPSPPSASATPRVTATAQDEKLRVTLSEREEEHDRAWKEAGSKIYSRLSPSFNLILDKSSRSSPSCEEPSSRISTQTRDASINQVPRDRGMKGLGIDLAISDSQHTAIKMGLMVEDRLVPNGLNPPRHHRRTATIEARRLLPQASRESLDMSSKSQVMGTSPNLASSSGFDSNHHALRRRSQGSGETSRLLDGARAAQSKRELRDPTQSQEEKIEEYELRRELRLKKRFADLQARICCWRETVPVIQVAEFPEIEPTPPTPSLASGMLRLSPFATRPTALPNGPSPPDIAIRSRALDALLGDMPLIQHHQTLHSFSLKSQGMPASTEPHSMSAPLENLEAIVNSVLPSERRLYVTEGMPTPKAKTQLEAAFP